MALLETPEARLALSLLLGLLLGVERERRKRERGHDSIAGLRTFGLAGFLGGLATYLNAPYAIAAGAVFIGALVVVAYALDKERERDKGITTELAVLLAYVLGALALDEPFVAGVSAIVTALLLHFRSALHHFVSDVLHDHEVHDGLLLLVFAFVALPLMPDVALGPYDAINPQSLARLMLVVTLISTAGYIAQRALGARIGLVASGLASGFVSSTATIAALGLRVRQDPPLAAAAASGAVASCIATVVQYGAIVLALDRELLATLALPLGLALATALAATYALTRGVASAQSTASEPESEPARGRAFQVVPALLVGGGSALVAVLAAAFADAVGKLGIVLISAASGLVDAHATAASACTLHRNGSIDASTAALAIVVALSSNTATKLVMAFGSGPKAYALRVAAGAVAIAAAAWLGLALA